MAVDGSPDAPIPAVRVEPATPAPVAAAVATPVDVTPPASPEPAAAAASPVAEPKVELVTERPSLLETFGKDAKPEVKAEAAADPSKPVEAAKPEIKAEPAKPEAKPEPAKPEGEVKPVEAAKPEPLAPIDYAYELPPTLKMDDAIKGELHTALDAFRADPAKGAQPLIDLHNKVVSDLTTQLAAETLQNQHKAFNETRTRWNTDWMADAEIGGSGYQTAMRAIARMRDQFVSDAMPGTPKYQADQKSFDDFLRITGAGDHPMFGRFLHNVARFFDEPAPPPPNIKPPPNHGQKPGSKRDKLYGPKVTS